MNSEALIAAVLIIALVAALFVAQARAGRPKPASDMDAVMDQYAQDAVQEAREKHAVVLDYSPASVGTVDAILARLHDRYVQHSVDAAEVGRQSRLWGAYLGAVIKKVRPARWEADVDDQETPALVFGLQDMVFPCAWAYKRIVHGEKDNIVDKYHLLITERDKEKNSFFFPDGSS